MLNRLEMSHALLLETCSNPVSFSRLIQSLSGRGYNSLFSILSREQTTQFLHSGIILSKIMKTLPENNRLLLLDTIHHDILRDLIKTRSDLGEILKALPSKNYDFLMDKLSLNFVDNIVRDGASLGYIMRMLHTDNHSLLLMALSHERVIHLFSNDDILVDKLQILSRNNYEGFIAEVFRATQGALHHRPHFNLSVYKQGHATLFSISNEGKPIPDASLEQNVKKFEGISIRGHN